MRGRKRERKGGYKRKEMKWKTRSDRVREMEGEEMIGYDRRWEQRRLKEKKGDEKRGYGRRWESSLHSRSVDGRKKVGRM